MVFVDRVVTGAYCPGGSVKKEAEKPFMNEPEPVEEKTADKPVEKPRKRSKKRAN